MVRKYQVEMQLVPQLTSTSFFVLQPVSLVVKILNVFKMTSEQGSFITVLTSRLVPLTFRKTSIH